MDKIKFWENAVKGWILSLAGLIIFCATVGNWLGFWKMPVYDGLALTLGSFVIPAIVVQTILSLVVSVVMFFSPETFEKQLESLFKKKTDSL